ncbi:uncharacterized protein BDV14DRAFT_172393 [Aspergillus stella-maris]|uniref:uncharacterized protein n=1 Tax=Aspergillus stella-maris TaxID=1810926 RepID=UPI003CCCD1B9
MNRFRKSKKESKKEKVKEEPVVTDSNVPPTTFGAILKKNQSKRESPEPTPDLDLASALPPTDDFRTSLLMPKLSARFSMLRDQDDPESLIGKASDDSVLFPKRASRLNLFGHNPSLLSDIDEVSVCGRPSFSNAGRGSYASGSDGYNGDDDSQHGSIMNRGRRTEGNNLFGGRQKVYKIADSGSGRGSGRALYEHDLGNAIFRPRVVETEKDEPTYTHESEDAMSSVSSFNRTTYSSTASGPTGNARISTAATSVDEHAAISPAQTHYSSSESVVLPKPAGPGMAAERGSVRTRRLYGQALEQSAQNHQSSALQRLESLSRQRAGTPEMPSLNRNYSRSAMNLRNGLQKLTIAEPSPVASRPTSPPSSATSPTRPRMETELKPPNYGQLPLSPPVSENEEVNFMAAVQPEDRGKATAMGMFNKPRTAYDDNQFSSRQLQMFQERSIPQWQQSQSQSQSPVPAPPQAPPPVPDFKTRSRGPSNASHQSRPGSSASSHYSEARRPGSRSTGKSVNASPARGHIGTFFDNSSPSETEDEGYPSRDDYSIHSEHPAFRSQTPSKPSTPTGEENHSTLPEVRYSDLNDLKPIAEHTETIIEQGSPTPEKPDSPTLPAGLGLSGLVRTHLRQDSDKSSIFPPPSPQFPPTNQRDSLPESIVEQSPLEQAPPPPMSVPPPPPIPDWRDELVAQHRRQGSTETQREREEFANELAERRRRVQEKLRDHAEGESRAASPVSGRATPDMGPKPGNAFALLKNKPGKHHLFGRGDPRGPKGFPFGGNASTPTLVSEDPWQEEDRMSFLNMGKHNNSSAPQVGERSMRSRIASFGRRSNEESRESSRSRGASPHSSFRSRRERSSSNASSRSKSRSRRDRDNLTTLEEDDTSDNSYESRNDRRGIHSVASSARPSLEGPEPSIYERAPSSASVYRPESRIATPIERPFATPIANSPIIGAPRPSPAAPPFSANATPPLYDINGDSPTTAAFTQPQQHIPQRAAGHNGLQKRAVDKSLISEPTFISCTSNVPTVGLPPGASLSNGMETPPLPPMNPRRRRQTTTQTILGAFKEKNDSNPGSPAPPGPVRTQTTPLPERGRETPQHEQSAFEDDRADRRRSRSRPRNRLRKVSSEASDMHAAALAHSMARGTMSANPSPAPTPPPFQSRIPMDGGMF